MVGTWLAGQCPLLRPAPATCFGRQWLQMLKLNVFAGYVARANRRAAWGPAGCGGRRGEQHGIADDGTLPIFAPEVQERDGGSQTRLAWGGARLARPA